MPLTWTQSENDTYRIFEEERGRQYRSLWEKKVYMNVCQIMITEIEMFESSTQYCSLPLLSRPIFRRFVFMGLMKANFTKETWIHEKKIIGLHFGCCCPQKGTWRSAQTTQELCTRNSKFNEFDNGIFEDLWSTVIYISFLCNKFVILTSN